MEQKLKIKNQYSSSILKFQLNKKMKISKLVAAISMNNSLSLENMAESIKKYNSEFFNDFKNNPMSF